MEKIQETPPPIPLKQVLLIAGFHLIILAGLLFPVSESAFIWFFPASLPLLFLLLAYINLPVKRLFLIFSFGVFICGFFAEILGVHAGSAFGKYQFGNVQAFKIGTVPAMMGIYFVILIYSVGQSLYYLPVKNIFLRSFIGSCMILVFDFFLEPAAARFKYWSWESGFAPLQNYAAWFIISFVLLQFFYAMHLPVKKQVGATLFVSQLSLFLLLYLWFL